MKGKLARNGLMACRMKRGPSLKSRFFVSPRTIAVIGLGLVGLAIIIYGYFLWLELGAIPILRRRLDDYEKPVFTMMMGIIVMIFGIVVLFIRRTTRKT